MGPKAKKGPGKKKLTKAERLKLQQEEEERRLREEEEARLRFEKEEQERLERMRIAEEKWHQLEEKDLERRNQELQELNLLEECFLEAEKLKQEIRSLSRWNHYIACDGRPDPSESQEMNTFISLWREEPDETFQAVIEKSKLVLYLIEKMKLILLETPPGDMDSKATAQYTGSVRQLQELLQLKLNRATELLLRQASNLADMDSGNMEKVIRDENINLYLWANLKKNPRNRSVRFSETQVGFEIPKILATSDIALRLLHTRYDHLTPADLALAPKEEGSVEVEPSQSLLDTQDVVQEDQEAENPESELTLTQDEEKQAEEQVKAKVQVMSIAEDLEAMKNALRRKLLSDKILEAQKLLVKNDSEMPEMKDILDVNLCQFTPLGGVFYLDILQLPPLCKPVKGWMMVELLRGELQNFTYPPESVEELDPENAFPPIEITLQLPENVVFFEEPMVVRWDAEGQGWKKGGISDVYYKEEDKLLSFSLEVPGPFTLVQDAHINMPYLSWEMVPLDLNRVLLTVTTAFTEFQIQIKENLCMLSSVKLKDQRPVSNLKGKWLALIPFITALKEVGLNIFPTRFSHLYVIINNKGALVEVKAYRQIALLSSTFAFGWSKWNAVCDSQKVVFKAREQAPGRPLAADWALLLFSGQRAQRLKLTEDSDAFSEAVEDGTEFHSSLFHMVSDYASPEALDRIRAAAGRHVDAVCQLLLATRLLSFS
ncbi:dynein axonemal intermediate chain 7 [Dipodomys spectabilis]|uniref:dynein axonemal intermediate chain 7 n=1 Tax=Dipodomys spectabilis TaxID=105255 RepID=UPI001C53EAB4|nr:dynein axonemal intermediate chain 7 [Dipodomys spectabilis]